MAIPSRQIGWSTKANLLWQISKQLEALSGIMYNRGNSTTTTTTTIAPFINTIIISNGSYTAANGTYTRDNPSGAFALTGGGGSIFFAGEVWYIFNTAVGNVARNTSTLGTGTWEAWAPGNSSGIIAEYSSYICPTTTTTTTAPLVFTNTTFVNCSDPCGFNSCVIPLSYFEVYMSQACIDSWPTIGCQVFLDSEGKIPFSTGNYNDGNGGCIYIENGVVIPAP